MTYLVTGGKGQLGTELTKLLESTGHSFVSLDSKELDILDKDSMRKVMVKEKPSVVFHCAAYTAVDKAEDEEKEINWQVNVEGTKNVAEICKELGSTLVYISTDYVFDGSSDSEYKEDSATNPINEYGKAKLAGEKVVQELLEEHFIIRTSWVFGEYGHNFVYTMKNLSKKHSKLTVIDDQIGRPTWTKSLAKFMLYVIQTNQPNGIYHFSNEGSCSWYEFATEILKKEEVRVSPILTKDYPQKAKRPMTSVMNLDKSKRTGFVNRHWTYALENFNNEIDK